MAEFYIRREGDEDASGPFDMDQIVSLVEAEKLDTEAYYYDIDAEDWIKIADNKEMMDTLFPKKKKLSLKGAAKPQAEEEEKEQTEAPRKPALKKNAPEPESASDEEAGIKESTPETPAEEEPETLSEEEQADEARREERRKARRKPRLKGQEEEEEKKLISVETMLAQAEGRPENDPGGKSPVEKQAQAAMLGLRMATFFVLASVVSMGYLDLDLLKSADVTKMFKSPYTIIASFDALLGLFLILGVTEIYSLLRFRAAVGAGLLSVLFLASGDPLLAASNVLVMLSLYLCTILINTPKVLLATLPGLIGVAGYAYILILPQI